MNHLQEKARKLDAADELASFRDAFHIPKHHSGTTVYFTGNSLGLQPKRAKKILLEELDDWADYGVEGHFEARRPWVNYHEQLMKPAADLVGAKPQEVVHMNGLTVNLHLLMVSFYRPKGKRYKIICEAKAFPSDQYALESQVKFHGYQPEEAIIEVEPREGEHLIREEDIISAIEENADELALVFWGGVNYYTGQFFDLKSIAEAGHKAGAIVGYDLAHAAGNVPLDLHDWNVDFAAWCTYKYLNSGPGSVSGIFVHEKHANDFDLPRFAGWWGHDKNARFKMDKGFEPMSGAEGWQLSNAPIFVMAPHLASLEVFHQAGFDRMRKKSLTLTAFLQEVIEAVAKEHDAHIEIITPAEPDRRGCQLSLLAHGRGKELFNFLQDRGVFADWREPNVIRIAPVPLYNSFSDALEFGKILSSAYSKKHSS
ncbi:kynureninase [Cryomorphaceae bacterium 1068]|nr:kynureninase [Cryomorphaceae bacterium 1068]